ncbi:MAG: hypothetical protein ABI707_05335 [Ferruginibacter sp.]
MAKFEIAAEFDGDGIAVIGSSNGPKDAGFLLVDDLGHSAALGLATANNAFMSGLESGDIVLLNLGNGKIYLGTGTNASFPAMSVAIGSVIVGNPNQSANLEVIGDFKVDGFLRGGRISMDGNVGIGTDTVEFNTDVFIPGNPPRTVPGPAKLHIVGNNDMAGTIRMVADAAKGPNQSHVHWDVTGDWYIRSAADNGRVVIQDQGPGAFVGIGTPEPTAKLDVNGDLKVSGDVFLTGGADCAEDFDITGDKKIEAGTVMVMDGTGRLEQASQPYDKKVAGIISGAGCFKSAITLDRQSSGANRQPIALLGKVYCKADAQFGAIEAGDLLTTSSTPGHAMKALDPFKAFGAVMGKALGGLREGCGLIPVLVTLQ